MEHIRGDSISFKHAGQVDNLLEDISFSLDTKSKVGLVGDNGCGKTTLLDLIRGELAGYTGALAIAKGTTIGYLPQEVSFTDSMTVADYLWTARENLHRLKKIIDTEDKSSMVYADAIARFYEIGGDVYEALMAKVLAGFAIESDKIALALEDLSGGEKTKVALARLLLREPDLLLLDEPTNHLEIASLVWLENYLKALSLPYIVVSHDRRFLDECVTEIWELHDRRLAVFSGNYSYYRDEKLHRRERMQQEYDTQQKKIRKLREAATERRQDADRMEKFKHTRSISKSGSVQKRDSGSGKGSTRATARMRAAKAVERRIRMMLEKTRAEKPRKIRERKIAFSESDLKTPVALRVENLTMRFDDNIVLDDINLVIGNGVKLGIIGCNGSGKSTLLNIITGNLAASGGGYRWAPQARVGYFSQEHETLDPTNSILDEIIDGDNKHQTRARNILGRLNIRGDKVFQTIATLSLGERSKVMLAKILFSEVNVLVFDEPTNHVELSAREAFEEALDEYDGTVIVASHDRYLLDRVADEIFHIEAGHHFKGTYAEYVTSADDDGD